MLQKGKEYDYKALDPGHSTAKVVDENGRFLFPTMASLGPLTQGVNGVFDSGISKKSIDNLTIATSDGIWYIGEIAKRTQRPHDAPFGASKYFHPNFLKLILLAALSEVKTTDTPVVLVTALPGKFYQDKAIKDAIRQMFIGYHTVSRVKAKGRRDEKVVQIDDVKIKSEPGALLFSHILDSKGDFVDGRYHNDMITVAIDIGELTTCINICKGLERLGDTQTHHSFTDISMGRIYGTVAGQVEEETRRHLWPWQVRDILIQGDGTIALNVKGQMTRYDLKPIYESEIAIAQGTLLTRVSQTVADVVDEDNVDVYLVGGGGASQIGGIIKNAYSYKVELCNQFSTAQGLANFGARLCKKTKAG
jgi:hypothetical protein